MYSTYKMNNFKSFRYSLAKKGAGADPKYWLQSNFKSAPAPAKKPPLRTDPAPQSTTLIGRVANWYLVSEEVAGRAG